MDKLRSDKFEKESFPIKYLVSGRKIIKKWILSLGGEQYDLEIAFDKLSDIAVRLRQGIIISFWGTFVLGLIGFTFRTAVFLPIIFALAIIAVCMVYIVDQYLFGFVSYINVSYLNTWFEGNDDDTALEKRKQLKYGLLERMLTTLKWGVALLIELPIVFWLIPILNYMTIHHVSWISQGTVNMLTGWPIFNHLVLMSAAYAIAAQLYARWMGKMIRYDQYQDEMLKEYEFYDEDLQKLYLPKYDKNQGNMILGRSVKTKEEVVVPVHDTKLNKLIEGVVGTGKTSVVFLRDAQQIIQKYIYFIRAYHELKEKNLLISQKGGANYVGGFVSIDPADFAEKAHSMALAMGLPEKVINHIKPYDENTRSLMIMHGPVIKVQGLLLEVLTPEKGGNDFFVQSERDYLRLRVYLQKYVTLLEQAHENKEAKSHNRERKVINPSLEKVFLYVTDPESTFEDLKKYRGELLAGYETLEGKIISEMSALDIDSTEYDYETEMKALETKFREVEMQHNIANGVFKVLASTFFESDKGMLVDTQQQYVKNLYNRFSELHTNPSVYRLLFTENDPINPEDIFKYGGINLYETGAQSQENTTLVSSTIARLEFIIHNNAVLNRSANGEVVIPSIMDEVAGYIYEGFPQVLAEARKYNSPYTMAVQAGSAQLSRQFGAQFYETLISNARTIGVFGGGSIQDAEVMSKIMGTYKHFELGMRNTFKPVESQVMTPEDIKGLEEFTIAYAYMQDNKQKMDVVSNPRPDNELRNIWAEIENLPESEKFDSSEGSDDMKALEEIWNDAANSRIEHEYSKIELELIDVISGLDEDIVADKVAAAATEIENAKPQEANVKLTPEEYKAQYEKDLNAFDINNYEAQLQFGYSRQDNQSDLNGDVVALIKEFETKGEEEYLVTDNTDAKGNAEQVESGII